MKSRGVLLREDGSDFRLVFMKLYYQLLYRTELQFGTGTAHECHPHGLIVNISVKTEDMHLDAAVHTIVQGRAEADAQHSRILLLS